MVGLLVLLIQRIQLRSEAGANEREEKPAFDEVWEASKFTFSEAELGDHSHNSLGSGSSRPVSVYVQ